MWCQRMLCKLKIHAWYTPKHNVYNVCKTCGELQAKPTKTHQ